MKSLFAIALALVATPLLADAQTDALTKPIDQFIRGFNKGDTKSAFAAYAPGSVSITDEFAPHVWTGPKAPQAWAARYDVHAKATGVTDGIVTWSAPTRVEVEGSVAYVIVPTLYTYKEEGKATREEGQMTFVLTKIGKAWKIRAWTWSGVPPHPAG
ncbi:MAG: hypothetical protein ACKOQM_14240 [Novosphingobium sp.]